MPLGVAALLACLGCARPPAGPPNVLVIAVSALRADQVARDDGSTPAIDALARSGTRYQTAYAAAPWIVPSVASLWTAALPSRHGVQRLDQRLPDEALTLAEVLAARGYATYAAVSDYRIARSRGLDQGFQVTSAADVSDPEGDSTEFVRRRTRAHLASAASSAAPSFVFAHFGALAPSRADFEHEVTDVRAPGSGSTLLERELARDREGYLNDLRAVDGAIASLLEALREQPSARPTLIVLVGTHGYEWGTRNWGEAAYTLDDDLVRVPLIIAGTPAIEAGRVVTQPVSIASLAPSLLELAGFDARELGPYALPLEARAAGAPVAFEVDYVPALVGVRSLPVRQRALRLERWKWVLDLGLQSARLYDLASDPDELEDRAPAQPAVAAECARAATAAFNAPGR